MTDDQKLKKACQKSQRKWINSFKEKPILIEKNTDIKLVSQLKLSKVLIVICIIAAIISCSVAITVIATQPTETLYMTMGDGYYSFSGTKNFDVKNNNFVCNVKYIPEGYTKQPQNGNIVVLKNKDKTIEIEQEYVNNEIQFDSEETQILSKTKNKCILKAGEENVVISIKNKYIFVVRGNENVKELEKIVKNIN